MLGMWGASKDKTLLSALTCPSKSQTHNDTPKYENSLALSYLGARLDWTNLSGSGMKYLNTYCH